ncbi:diaminopimelate epimerase [Francisella sp. SYW-9]|uniref:diaminopimelate epimerase n=1 Tax=Francisella sp. SYW-9 TaxID=2610888 RepID=UPI00123D7E0C|nr:diaminopimelate epimerase [Francisella sp. SYW-9]
MHASGNDFIVIDQREDSMQLAVKDIKALCDRRYGIGADQLLLLRSAKSAICQMNIFNKDGTAAKQCGNGLRSVAYLMYQKHNIKNFDIEVKGALHRCEIINDCEILVEFPLPKIINKRPLLNIDIDYLDAMELSVGNPHLVLWLGRLTSLNIPKLGKCLQDAYLPEGVNVHFVECVDQHTINIRHFERGTGVTLSCGSGSIASVYSGVINGLIETPVMVKTATDSFQIHLTNKACMLIGNAELVFEGTYFLEE